MKKTIVSGDTRPELTGIIVSPVVSEKTAYGAEKNTYTFIVNPRANKTTVKRAITAIYKVTPTAVNMITNKSQRVFVRGRIGQSKLTKKAMVTLKKGDTIELA